jgi:hypothetical protein
MFTLIKREIRDNLVYFVGAIAISGVFICISIPPLYSGGFRPLLGNLGIIAVIIASLAFFAMGATQMYIDKNRRISAYLATLSVSRDQILAARIVTAVLAILIFFVPLIIMAVISISLLNRYSYPPYQTMIFEVSTGILLLVFACYCIGLLIGWTEGRIVPGLGGLVLVLVFGSLIILKGFGFEFFVILIPFIAACLFRVRQKFISTSL